VAPKIRLKLSLINLKLVQKPAYHFTTFFASSQHDTTPFQSKAVFDSWRVSPLWGVRNREPRAALMGTEFISLIGLKMFQILPVLCGEYKPMGFGAFSIALVLFLFARAFHFDAL
jgi:hypothetical protein